jgi:hypothetical protein
LLPIVTLSDFDSQTEKGNVMDPDSLNPDPEADPSFQVNPDTNPDSGF